MSLKRKTLKDVLARHSVKAKNIPPLLPLEEEYYDDDWNDDDDDDDDDDD